MTDKTASAHAKDSSMYLGKPIVATLLALVLLFAIGTVFDLPIGQMIVHQELLWPLFVNSLYTFSAALLRVMFCIVAATWLCRLLSKSRRISKFIAIAGIAFLFGLVFVSIWAFFSGFIQSVLVGFENVERGKLPGVPVSYSALYSRAICFAITLVSTIIVFVLAGILERYVTNNRLSQLLAIAIGGLVLTVVCSDSTIILLKDLFGRPRPYQVFGAVFGGSDMSLAYHTWYAADPFSGNNSFPSGHNFLFWQCAYICFFFTNKNVARAAFGICIILGVLMMASRMLYGMHWLTDVSCGAFIALLATLCIGRIALFACKRIACVDITKKATI